MNGAGVAFGRARKLERPRPVVEVVEVVAPPPPPPPPVSRPRRGLTLEDVRREVLRAYGIALEDFMGRGRPDDVVEARGVFVELCRRERNVRASYPQITAAMRARPTGHTTAITAHRRVRRQMPADARLRERVREVQQALDLLRGMMTGGTAGYRVEGEAGLADGK